MSDSVQNEIYFAWCTAAHCWIKETFNQTAVADITMDTHGYGMYLFHQQTSIHHQQSISATWTPVQSNMMHSNKDSIGNVFARLISIVTEIKSVRIWFKCVVVLDSINIKMFRYFDHSLYKQKTGVRQGDRIIWNSYEPFNKLRMSIKT